MVDKSYAVYKFSRGTKYACTVTIINGTSAVFSGLTHPPGTSTEVVRKLLDDAEESAFKQYDKDCYGEVYK